MSTLRIAAAFARIVGGLLVALAVSGVAAEEPLPPLGPTPNPAPGCVELMFEADGGFTIQGETYVGVSRLLGRAEVFVPGLIAAGTKIYTLSKVWKCPKLSDAEATAKQYNASQNTTATPKPAPTPTPSSRLPHGG